MHGRRSVAAVLALFAVLSGSLGFAHARQIDAQIRQAIIKQSIAEYGGSCPCPYNNSPQRFELWWPQCL